MLLWFIIAFSDSALSALLANDRTFFGLFQINEVFTQTDIAYARFIIIGIGIMLLMIFRPQGIIGDRREVLLDAR
jgi:branched-chain amino acid transport system permease protein